MSATDNIHSHMARKRRTDPGLRKVLDVQLLQIAWSNASGAASGSISDPEDLYVGTVEGRRAGALGLLRVYALLADVLEGRIARTVELALTNGASFGDIGSARGSAGGRAAALAEEPSQGRGARSPPAVAQANLRARRVPSGPSGRANILKRAVKDARRRSLWVLVVQAGWRSSAASGRRVRRSGRYREDSGDQDEGNAQRDNSRQRRRGLHRVPGESTRPGLRGERPPRAEHRRLRRPGGRGQGWPGGGSGRSWGIRSTCRARC